MADNYRKISDFTKTNTFGNEDLLLVSQSGVTRVITGTVLKKFANAAGIEAAKINSAAVTTDGELVLTTTDGTTINAGQVVGVSVTGASIDDSYHLILTLSDGTTADAGYCRGASGDGTGDMLAQEYDPDGEVRAAGGIKAVMPTILAASIDDPTPDVIDGAILIQYDPEETLE